MDRKQFKIWKKIIALFLIVVFLFQPLVGVGVLAEDEPTPEPTTEPQNTPTEVQPSPTEEPVVLSEVTATPIPDTATASDSQTTTVTNDNSAQVVNDIDATSNSGNNEINPSAGSGQAPSPTATPEVGQDNTSETPTPAEVTPASEESTSPTPEVSPTCGVSLPTETPEQGVGSFETDSEPSPTPTPEILPTPGPLAENIDTPENSSNTALCISQAQTTVTNENQALVFNETTATASTGENQAVGENPEIGTGEASVGADLANIVNFNVIGEDFWTEVFNLLGVNNGDLDFSSIDTQNRFNEAFAAVLARNLITGDGSVNISAVDFLKSLMVINNNVATVSNILDLAAISGQNSAVGGDGVIDTGNASVYANLFNLINTNLIGTNFWFGIFNIFGEQNGDIILPYELQFLQTEIETEGVTAVNQNPGESSQNLAVATSTDTTTINNNNDAVVTNNVDVLADTGTNTAEVCGSAEIKTGSAEISVDIRNFINTNIFGGRFVFLLINIFGQWQGMLLNWWGNTASDGQSVLAVGQLPPAPQPADSAQTTALNSQTGDNSQNVALADSTSSLTVTNNNQAFLTNEIKGQAISGQNNAEGNSAKIGTGNSSVIANIANFVNTNIIGNNFFFGIINIFGKLTGNILFPRPDLEIQKSVDMKTASPGETLTYSIAFRNLGNLWAKDVEINDYLPAGVSFLSSDGIFEDGKVSWKLGKINPGEGGVVSLMVRVSDGLGEGTQVANQALISTTTNEPKKDNNQGSAATTVRLASSQSDSGQGGVDSVAGTSGTCTPPEAPLAPTLISASLVSSTQVQLTWTKVERASYYLMAYGLESGNYIYGSPNVGNVDSYLVEGLTPGKIYYFVVAGVADGDCPAVGPFSNELSSGSGSVLGVEDVLVSEGEIGEGIFTQDEGMVAGAATPVCPWWGIVLAGEALILGGFYSFMFLKGKKLKFWWLGAPVTMAAGFLVDKFTHHWYIPSQYCQYVPWGGLAIGGIESLAFKMLKNKKGEK